MNKKDLERIKKMMVTPEDAYTAMHYFENDKLHAIGILRNNWNEDKTHSFSTWLELPVFAEIFRPLESTSIRDFIHNFLSRHDKTHDNKLIKITIEVLKDNALNSKTEAEVKDV